jgi:hypothetical protein
LGNASLTWVVSITLDFAPFAFITDFVKKIRSDTAISQHFVPDTTHHAWRAYRERFGVALLAKNSSTALFSPVDGREVIA